MPWIIGIDEAGYGPNLGPLVMTAVAFHVPPEMAAADLWHVLRAAVRRTTDADDDRLLIADSKQVYSSARGLAALETGVLAHLPPSLDHGSLTLTRYLDWVSPAAVEELEPEPWYSGQSRLPVTAATDGCTAAATALRQACVPQRVACALVRSVVICAARFNRLVEQAGSKGAVLGHALKELLRCHRQAADDEPLAVFVDKHGGRNTYAPMLQDAIPDGMVVARQECMQRSVYEVLGTRQPIRLTFQPRADDEHFCVALASMVSKYLREVLMLEFNRFWQTQVPGLRPTAGYPGDAARFLEAIRPAVRRLGLAETAVWRMR